MSKSSEVITTTDMRSPLVPLATLIGRELRGDKVGKPSIRCGQAGLAKKGEDYFLIKPDCQRIPGNPSTSFSVYAVYYYFLAFILVFVFLVIEMLTFDQIEMGFHEF